tara:strand:+ start:393 stop:767 length:375 start_codon:yes stop_codon:yes gene_type:complete
MIYLAKLVDAFGWMNEYSEYFDAVSFEQESLNVHPDLDNGLLQTKMLEAHAAFDQQLADLLLHLSPMELSVKLRRVYGNDPNLWLWLSPEEEEVYLNHERLAYHIEMGYGSDNAGAKEDTPCTC